MKCFLFLEVLFLGKIIQQRYNIDKRIFKYMIWIYVPPAPPPPVIWFPPIVWRLKYNTLHAHNIGWVLTERDIMTLDWYVSRNETRYVCCFCQHWPSFVGDDDYYYVKKDDNNEHTCKYQVCLKCKEHAADMGYVQVES